MTINAIYTSIHTSEMLEDEDDVHHIDGFMDDNYYLVFQILGNSEEKMN